MTTDRRSLLTVESFRNGRKTLHWETFLEPLTDLDRANAAQAWTLAGLDDLVDDYVADGYSPEAARQRVTLLIVGELAQRSHDDEAYERVCARKGLLPL